MDNYPYKNPYPYPYHSGYPPPNQDPYAPPPYQYPYNSPQYPYPPPSYLPPTSHSAPLDYPHSHSHSGPIPYQYPYPVSPNPIPHASSQPTLQHHGSFQYGSSSYPYQQSLAGHYPTPESNPQVSSPYHQPAQYPPPESNSQVSSPYQQPAQYPPPESNSELHSRHNSFSGHNRQESTSSLGANTDTIPSVASAYPPLDDLLSNVHLSDSRPTAPASPPAPSGAALPTATSTPELQSPVYGHATSGDFYGYPNNSFPSKWEGPYLGRMESSNHSVFSHTGSFNGSQHGQSMQIVPFQKGSLRVLLLHGNLDIWVFDAKNLPNMDMFHKTLGDMFGRLPVNVTNKIEGHMNRKITSDPYVSIAVSGAVVGRTYVISNSENPVWMQHFNVPVAHYAAEVHFVVKDSDVVGSQLIGIVTIPVEQIYSGEKIEGIYPILNNNGKPCKPGAVLRLSIQYTPMEKLSFYHHGVGAGPEYLGVPGTYFPLRKGGTVTLYQDAHVPDGCLPNLKLDQGTTYVHGKCWSDIFDAIRQARRLIYITGWSVWHKVTLVRDAGPASDCTLGDILRSKSQEGVRVLLLIWDDPTSRSILGYKTDGIMQTHDEETRRFFKHSSVQVLLCPRIAGKRHSWVKQKEVGTIYTHHQKTVIVDANAGENRRKIIAFLGGLDLCDGRYDTPHHPIFRTLQTVHKDDYHNPTFTGNVAGCPREPWHDLHCRIDGPAAYDVLVNFEERWFKASKPHGIKKLKMSYDDALLRIERIPDIIGVSDFPGLNENDPEAWHVQIFRSIDSNSVKGFPKDPKDATSKNLVCGKNVLIDMSIHTAYVKAIRAAQHFIYIENQYFIGSSYNWNSYKDLGANNLIPMEIALKIASKIKANERFAAYIVVPMWPEGVPTGAATQRILFWQHKTMQMMYETIYRALVEAGLEGAFSPQDFLNFFCLGNRELDGFESSGLESPSAPNTPQALSRKSRRFMIYVHSKGMIVDDEYVILGSANINQRSMEGTRDTEIAMGAYQPQHTWAKKLSNPHGQIYGYRMSLWAEHLGVVEDCFKQPESVECVRRVKQMAEINWKQFAADEITEMRGHLLKYPVDVDRKGKVKPHTGCESFPDVGGNIVGSFLGIQENLTI
ncbi:phospholipase D beta 1-like isoform X2 [Durio zibethinus]|uniref:phospholipase D n=1 Tax=Durio zibethinus TaxID=66656 RepID=A0A6P5ZXB0_DURZI|nr:phospholipase D beta 1-like isoform X2 [Durio zibethinus]